MFNSKVTSIKIPKEGFLVGGELSSKEYLTLAAAILMVEEERIFLKDTLRADFHTD
jgi:replicative DNA helicase